MKKGLTEIVFILDRSGSMGGLETDTIGGYNSMLNKQKLEDGEANVTTVLFDNEYELLHDRISLKGISPVTDKEYYVRGTTENVLFIIITDGMENASTEYTSSRVKKMVERQKSKYGWEFIFLGANIDAIETANRFGIKEDRAVNYHPDSEGTILNYGVLSDTISMVRSKKSIDSNWKEKIDEDYKVRGREK